MTGSGQLFRYVPPSCSRTHTVHQHSFQTDITRSLMKHFKPVILADIMKGSLQARNNTMYQLNVA